MLYAWYDLGPTEYGIELATEAALADGGVCENFGDAKAALIRSLAATRDAYQEAINSIRALRRDEVN
jgi:hypothetical protein